MIIAGTVLFWAGFALIVLALFSCVYAIYSHGRDIDEEYAKLMRQQNNAHGNGGNWLDG